VFAGSGYFAYNGVLYFNSGDTLLGYVVSIIYLALWLVFLVGVASYLIFFTRNTFRMYFEPIADEDEEGELND
jgi:hypothetical protein